MKNKGLISLDRLRTQMEQLQNSVGRDPIIRKNRKLLKLYHQSNLCLVALYFSLESELKNIREIQSVAEYRRALWRINELFDCDDPDSPEGKELLELTKAVSDYEDKLEPWSKNKTIK